MEDKTELRISKHELDCLKEYQEAYNYLLEYWESFEKEQKKQINKDLNKIFVLNDGEQIKE